MARALLFGKYKDCTVYVAKTKALIICVVQLICVFVFAYAKSRFSHDGAHIFLFQTRKRYITTHSNSSRIVYYIKLFLAIMVNCKYLELRLTIHRPCQTILHLGQS